MDGAPVSNEMKSRGLERFFFVMGLSSILTKARKRLISSWSKKIRPQVTFYPAFRSHGELSSHFTRACWYLPSVPGVLDNVYLFRGLGCSKKPERPPYMCASPRSTSHITVRKGFCSLLRELFSSRVVLVWKNTPSFFLYLVKVFGIPVVNIDTEDEKSVEYGNYCGLFWRYLLTHEERYLENFENYQKFCEASEYLGRVDYKAACVFGTGPSIDEVFQFDFSDCISIVCNSIVQNEKLLEHIQPKFICAGDVVSHFGVSKYAEQFRADLLSVLEERDVYFFTTADFGYLFLLNHPEARKKTILVGQKLDLPNFDLRKKFALPMLASTLNIHMLPLASSFSPNIFVLGCDGKSPKKEENEDFWAHSRSAQYHQLVETGHQCHPTFDIHRQNYTFYGRYLKSVELSINEGEKLGNRYWILSPSSVPTLSVRRIPECRLQQNIQVARLTSEPDNGPVASDGCSELKERLEFRYGVSQISFQEHRPFLFVKGWALSDPSIQSIRVIVDGEFQGWAVPAIRPDISAKYPLYEDDWCGFFLGVVDLSQKKQKFWN